MYQEAQHVNNMKNKSIEEDWQKIQMLGLEKRGHKIVIINLFKEIRQVIEKSRQETVFHNAEY